MNRIGTLLKEGVIEMIKLVVVFILSMVYLLQASNFYGFEITKVDYNVRDKFIDVEAVLKNVSNSSYRYNQFILSARMYDKDDILVKVRSGIDSNNPKFIDRITVGDGWRWSFSSIYHSEPWNKTPKEIRKVKLQIINRDEMHTSSGNDGDIKIISPILVKEINNNVVKNGTAHYYWITKNMTNYGLSVSFFIKFWDKDDVPIGSDSRRMYLDPQESAYNHMYCFMENKEITGIARYEFSHNVNWRYTGSYYYNYVLDFEENSDDLSLFAKKIKYYIGNCTTGEPWTFDEYLEATINSKDDFPPIEFQMNEDGSYNIYVNYKTAPYVYSYGSAELEYQFCCYACAMVTREIKQKTKFLVVDFKVSGNTPETMHENWQERWTIETKYCRQAFPTKSVYGEDLELLTSNVKKERIIDEEK